MICLNGDAEGSTKMFSILDYQVHRQKGCLNILYCITEKYLPRSWDKDRGEKILLPTLIDPKSEMETSSFISKISIHQLLAMSMEEKGSKIYNKKKSSSIPYVSIVFKSSFHIYHAIAR